MRIAVVHSFYSSSRPSGENRVVVDQVDALREAGHEVALFGRHTDDEEQSRLYPLRAAYRAATGRGADPVAELVTFRPDVVHVHNLFPNFGTDWLVGWPGPVVVSVHNFRSVCANGMLFRAGSLCTECPRLGNHRSVLHGCYRQSRLATVPVAIGLRRRGTAFLRAADAVVTTSSASDAILTRLVGDGLRTVLIPNFGALSAEVPRPTTERHGWVAMGRLSPEKGFRELVGQWPAGVPLTVIGDGPERDAIEAVAQGKGIGLEPSMEITELRQRLPGFRGLVFPSLWPDVAPQVVVEAMRVGLPVIAHEANGVGALVRESGAGATYRDTATLAASIGQVDAELAQMSARAGDVFRAQWTRQAWLAAITRLYESVG